MSLGTPPLASRPLPPSRVRTKSMFTSAPRHGISAAHSAGQGESRSSRAGVMGGLRERTEDELKRASRQALEEALREEWAERDNMLEKIQILHDQQEKLERQAKEQAKALELLRAREEEAMQTQSRMEADLIERDEILELLRHRLAQAEREGRDAQQRVKHQDIVFEAERQTMRKQEEILQQRIESLTSTRTKPAQTVRSDDQTAAQDSRIQEELATLHISHPTVLAKYHNLEKEVKALKERNVVLKEENEGWEFLVRERTFSSKLAGGSLLDINTPSKQEEVPHSASKSNHLDVLDEEIEMHELHSDLANQSPIFEDHEEFAKDLDESAPMSSAANGQHLMPPIKHRPKGENLGDLPVTGSGLDLAAELGRAEADLGGDEMRVLGKGDEGEALRAEVKNLRDANKALTLYCSKIIDRIIAQEGFEQILSVDYKSRKLGDRSTSASGRGSAQALFDDSQRNPEVDKHSRAKPRPISMAVGVEDSEEMVSAISQSGKDVKVEKRAKRGFSIDFRSFGFGSSSSSPPDNKQAGLRPLTLSSQSPQISRTPPLIQGRKLEPQGEDENDRRERHHMEATLKLMGIDKPASTEPPTTTSAPRATSTVFESRPLPRPASARQSSASGGRRSLTPDFREGTPLSRLSSHLGSPERSISPLSPVENEGSSPRSIAAALEAFDAQEAKKVKAMSKGKAVTDYTSPNPSVIRRVSSARRRDSAERRMRESGSTSTLWSIGDDHQEAESHSSAKSGV